MRNKRKSGFSEAFDFCNIMPYENNLFDDAFGWT
jgi:hypothetical protein